eukprot:scaffold18400_cov70-Skeletonema_dohrnii-CCMP3373.AAC.1
MAANGYYIYNGREAVPRHVTRVRIHESLTVIPAHAFDGNRNIEELECHDRVKTVEERAFFRCRSLRKVIMPGVKVVGWGAFAKCYVLTDVECDKLEIIGLEAFDFCKSLTSINLPSARVVENSAFVSCKALTNAEFGKELESIVRGAFSGCTSLERITIPLKDDMITHDNIFRGCEKLKHVDLVGGAVLSDTIAALLLEEWKIDINEEINSINHILPTTPAGNDFDGVDGGMAQAVRMWIRAVLHKIIHYKAEHHSILNEAASALQLALPQDIVIKNVLPFLELPNIAAQASIELE